MMNRLISILTLSGIVIIICILLWPLYPSNVAFCVDNNLVDLIGHLAWPVTVLILVFIFRAELINLANRLIEAPPGFKFRTSQDSIRVEEAVPEKKYSGYAQSVLATLWKYQQQHFPKDPTGIERWTFMVHPKSKNFEQFMLGVTECMNAGLVGFWPYNQQYYLLDKGIEYCGEHNEELEGLAWALD